MGPGSALGGDIYLTLVGDPSLFEPGALAVLTARHIDPGDVTVHLPDVPGIGYRIQGYGTHEALEVTFVPEPVGMGAAIILAFPALYSRRRR